MTVKSDSISELAQSIRQTRKVAGLTQMQLAVKAGVGKDLIYKLEKGSAQITFENILKVLRVLNIKIQFKLPFGASGQDNG